MTKLRYTTLWLVLLLILGLTNWSIFQKEQLLADGQIVLLELAPVDPRSLIQGDYMALRYALARDVDLSEWPNRGLLVVTLDANNVATFQRLHNPTQPLTYAERLLEYHKRDRDLFSRGQSLAIGAESFFFQEGHAHYYNNADYGELRVTPSGQSVLVGLRDQNFQPLGPPPN